MAGGLLVPAVQGLGAAAGWAYRAYRAYRAIEGAKRLGEMTRGGNAVLNEAKPEECTGKCKEAKKAKNRKEVLKDATRDPDKTTLKDGTEQYTKPGGMPEANADYDSMQPQTTSSPRPGTRIGVLSDGTQVVVRPRSVPRL
ncbi:hypothetical protein [Methylobacterium indicum]|uniref:hypothetical protein n=1 Tax=Methylobacterium indicum TaxID=1775910 RepID=UPI00243548CD|nr:hypothetical protein [Methylobacterium indicum]